MIIIRNTLMILGIIGVVIFLGGTYKSFILMGASIVAIFLGITDFGRQRPLVLSVQHFLYREKSNEQ